MTMTEIERELGRIEPEIDVAYELHLLLEGAEHRSRGCARP
jgi:hypothetical protein